MINRSESQLFARDHQNQTLKAKARRPASQERSRTAPSGPRKAKR